MEKYFFPRVPRLHPEKVLPISCVLCLTIDDDRHTQRWVKRASRLRGNTQGTEHARLGNPGKIVSEIQ